MIWLPPKASELGSTVGVVHVTFGGVPGGPDGGSNGKGGGGAGGGLGPGGLGPGGSWHGACPGSLHAGPSQHLPLLTFALH